MANRIDFTISLVCKNLTHKEAKKVSPAPHTSLISTFSTGYISSSVTETGLVFLTDGGEEYSNGTAVKILKDIGLLNA